MTEEEIWQQLEAKQVKLKLINEQIEAAFAAQKFMEACSVVELSTMTLAKAFELGFRRGRT
jgi:hypothetical protein